MRNHVAPSNSSACRAARAARLGAADRVAADEARVASGCAADRRPSSSPRPTRRSAPERPRVPRARPPAARRPGPRRARASAPASASASDAAGSSAPRSPATASASRVGIPAGDPVDARAARGEPDRGADQARADDGEGCASHRSADALAVGAGDSIARISSATRKARSSDWRPFRRGSQSVS